MKAGPAAASLWVVRMGSCLVFQLYATNGGGVALGTFSAQNRIDPNAWTAALILMAAATIGVRTANLLWRNHSLTQRARMLAASPHNTGL
ncbi:hypothetical protein HQQ80_13765 [Microbacteriaceae bacterium VKM Ac-2855]|nr:hypothetical protein [Microbacteriaceae bacterium VKM Ac-2855]